MTVTHHTPDALYQCEPKLYQCETHIFLYLFNNRQAEREHKVSNANPVSISRYLSQISSGV